MIDPAAAYGQEVENYRNHVRNKYKDMEQFDRIEAMMVDIFAMIYVVGIVKRNSDREFI